MERNKEGKLETRIIYPQDFFPILGWFAYAERSPHPDRIKEKVYRWTVNGTQLGWVIGLVANGQALYDFVVDQVVR